jgi:putative ABC transport system substrate-binding protein
VLDARRHVLALLALGVLTSFPALSQQGRVWKIGILSIRPRPVSLDNDFQYGPFLAGLRELGYVEGKNLALEWRFAHGQYELLPGLAAELVGLKVDVIAAVNVPVIRALQQATRTIPIVILTASDPVGAGFVASLARPGGNITGLSNITSDLSAKYLELLGIILPNVSTFAFLLNPENSTHRAILKDIEAAAAKAGMTTVPIAAANPQQLETGFAAAAKQQARAVIVGIDSLFNDWRKKIVELTIKHRMPGIFPNRGYVEAGGLMSYGQDFSRNYRHAATYVDKILKGAKPADLPVELASNLQLIVNRKAANALGLTIPTPLLLRADGVID